MKKNNRGFSLLEIMVVVGMLGGLSLVLMNITKQTSKASTKFQFDTEINLITSEINAIISNPAKCLTTFQANNLTPNNIDGKYFTVAGGAPTGGYGNASVQLVSYSLAHSTLPGATANDGILTILFQNKAIVGGTTTPRTINVYYDGPISAITACRALSTSTTDIWSHGTGANANDIFYAGKVGIGLVGPTAKLDVAGNLQVSGTINATGVITSASDRRFKKDLTSLDSSLKKILRLRGVGFSWRDKNFGKGKQIGFIAQEVEEIYPELVYTNSKGMKFVAYQNLVAPLVEAIRDQQTEIETLKIALCENNSSLKFCK